MALELLFDKIQIFNDSGLKFIIRRIFLHNVWHSKIFQNLWDRNFCVIIYIIYIT